MTAVAVPVNGALRRDAELASCRHGYFEKPINGQFKASQHRDSAGFQSGIHQNTGYNPAPGNTWFFAASPLQPFPVADLPVHPGTQVLPLSTLANWAFIDINEACVNSDGERPPE